MKSQKTIDAGPLFNRDGSVAVDAKKYPTLHRALSRSHAAVDGMGRAGWGRVVELRRAGEADAAGRLVRKLLGIQGLPMSEETKEKLRQYNEEHKDEIKERRQQQVQVRRRTIALLTTGRRR
jgi:hypothetical protein